MLLAAELLRLVYGLWVILLVVAPFMWEPISLSITTILFLITIPPAVILSFLLLVFLPGSLFFTLCGIVGVSISFFAQWILTVFVIR